jgi:hypothetical protein
MKMSVHAVFPSIILAVFRFDFGCRGEFHYLKFNISRFKSWISENLRRHFLSLLQTIFPFLKRNVHAIHKLSCLDWFGTWPIYQHQFSWIVTWTSQYIALRDILQKSENRIRYWAPSHKFFGLFSRKNVTSYIWWLGRWPALIGLIFLTCGTYMQSPSQTVWWCPLLLKRFSDLPREKISVAVAWIFQGVRPFLLNIGSCFTTKFSDILPKEELSRHPWWHLLTLQY